MPSMLGMWALQSNITGVTVFTFQKQKLTESPTQPNSSQPTANYQPLNQGTQSALQHKT
jgi:hypothetical protein